jgi:hypothetical protein
MAMMSGGTYPSVQSLEVFRPWRSERSYAISLVILTSCFLAVCYLEASVILDSQIALGVDPTEASKWVALACLTPHIWTPPWDQVRAASSFLLLYRGAMGIAVAVDAHRPASRPLRCLRARTRRPTLSPGNRALRLLFEPEPAAAAPHRGTRRETVNRSGLLTRPRPLLYPARWLQPLS